MPSCRRRYPAGTWPVRRELSRRGFYRSLHQSPGLCRSTHILLDCSRGRIGLDSGHSNLLDGVDDALGQSALSVNNGLSLILLYLHRLLLLGLPVIRLCLELDTMGLAQAFQLVILGLGLGLEHGYLKLGIGLLGLLCRSLLRLHSLGVFRTVRGHEIVSMAVLPA